MRLLFSWEKNSRKMREYSDYMKINPRNKLAMKY